MENKEQKIKMLVTAIGDETNSAESIDEAISKAAGESPIPKEDFEREESEEFSRFMKLVRMGRKNCNADVK